MLFTCVWLFVCLGVVLCQSIETSQIHIIDEQGNWWEAQSRCKVQGGRLYTSGTDDIPAELVEDLQSRAFYWIGAMTYSAWLWTVDGSPLFTYAGFLPLASVVVEPYGTFIDNSVWKCHLHCSPANTVGMKGPTCYCLEEGYNTMTSRIPEDTCPGNFDEKCGNIQGVSVYKLENITFYPKEDTYCAYVVRADANLSIHTTHCEDVFSCFSCLVGGTTSIFCRRPKKSWFAAEKACDLVKLNASVQNRLLGFSSTIKHYWIGLHQYLHRKWTNGEWADEYLGDTSSDTSCLSVYKGRYGGMRLYWRPCSENRTFICEVNTPTVTSKSSPQSSSSITKSTTVIPASSPQPPPSTTESQSLPSPGTTDSITSGTHQQMKAVKPSINPAADVYRKEGFIGLGVGCLLLISTVLVVVYLLRRQKKLCFEKRDGNQSIHFTSAAENIPYGLAAHATESEAYTVVTPPDTSTVPTAIVRPSVHSDNVYINNAQIKDENEYNVLSKFDSSKVPEPHWNPYNHLSGPDGGNKYKGDYDTANWVPRGEELTTGLRNTVTHPDVPSAQVFEEEPYNVPGQHNSPRTVDAIAGVYDHTAVGEEDYDTALRGKNTSEVDDSYSHIQRTTEPCEEHTYVRIAGERQSGRFAGDTYNHDVKVDDGRGDTTDYYNTRSVLRDNGNLEGHVEGDDESVRRDQENVYSIATDISDV